MKRKAVRRTMGTLEGLQRNTAHTDDAVYITAMSCASHKSGLNGGLFSLVEIKQREVLFKAEHHAWDTARIIKNVFKADNPKILYMVYRAVFIPED